MDKPDNNSRLIQHFTGNIWSRITLRDLFAMARLAGLHSCEAYKIQTCKATAAQAYADADAMLVERAQEAGDE